MVLVVLRIAALLAVLIAIHFALDWWLRRTRRRQLEREHAEGMAGNQSRDEYLARGLAAHERSWERRLLVGIYLVPILIALGLALLMNYG